MKESTKDNDSMNRLHDEKVAIIGAGAMGCLLGGLFCRNRVNVVFVESNKEKRDALNCSGLTFVEGSLKEVFPVRVVSPETRIESVKLAVVCVKAYDTETAARCLAERIDDEVPVLTLQNGLGNIEVLARELGCDRVLSGTVSLGAYMASLTTVVYAGRGEIHIGEMDGQVTSRLKRFAGLFRTCGMDVRISEDVKRLVWSKLVINAGINALTAILRVENGVLLEISLARELMFEAVEETLTLAQKEGVVLDVNEMRKKVRAVVEGTASNRSSMLMDTLKGVETEIANINGAVAERAEALGVQAPVNKVLYYLVQAGYEARMHDKELSTTFHQRSCQ